MLARILASDLKMPVVDRTGIEGTFDVDLEWTPDRNIDPGPSIFTAVREQLGLKLESARAPVDVPIVWSGRRLIDTAANRRLTPCPRHRA